MNKKKALLFIDGFNLYHSLNNTSDNTSQLKKYKWLNLWALGEKIVSPSGMSARLEAMSNYVHNP